MTRPWLKRGAVILLAFLLCWGGAVWYWRATNRMPAGGDLVTYLVALPVALLAVVWGGMRIASLMTAAPAAALPAPVPTAAAEPADAPAPPLAIVDVAIRMPHGDSAAQLAQAFTSRSARAALDNALVDENGFPAMTARAASAVDASLKAACMAWWAQHGMGTVTLADAQWRALTLASSAAADLAGTAALALADDAGIAPPLRIVAVLPPEWPETSRRAMAQWLRHTVAEAGWPAEKIVAECELPAGLLTWLALAPKIAERMPATLLVACDSQLDQASVDQLSDRSRLFTTTRPHGVTPGEGAAALLLTDPRDAHAHAGASFTLLHAAALDRRDSPDDASARDDGTRLGRLAGQALQHADIPASSVALAVADTGLRANRVLEASAVMTAALPHLDASEDLMCVGAASGNCGAVPILAALALAHQQALERGKPVLILSNEDPHHRCAALIGPAAFAS